MQNPLLKFKQALLLPRNQGICLKKWRKLLLAPTTMEFNIFRWNFAHVFYLLMSTKACRGFFLFCLDLELLINLVSVSLWKPGLFLFWHITQDLNKRRKPPSICLISITKLYKKSVHKSQFYINHASQLNSKKTNFYLLGISRLTKNHQYYKSSLRKRLTQTFILPKFSNNACHKVVRRRKKCHDKFTQSIFLRQWL